MIGLDNLIVAFILYASGYGTRWYTEPVKECKTIEFELSESVRYQFDAAYCKRGVDASGVEHKCYISAPVVYEFLPSQLAKLDAGIIDLQLNLFECYDLKEKYNKDKFILK